MSSKRKKYDNQKESDSAENRHVDYNKYLCFFFIIIINRSMHLLLDYNPSMHHSTRN